MKYHGNGLTGAMTSIGGIDHDHALGAKMAAPQREQALVEKMASTANRLEDVEGRLTEIRNWLYGPEPQSKLSEANYGVEPNVLSLANRTHYSVVRIEDMLADIYRRLAYND